MANNNSIRARQWTFILYPESAPDNWKDILNDQHIEYIVSPLHDKDADPDGEIKKAHYHVMLTFGNLKAFNQITEITKDLNQPIPQKVHNTRTLIRYFTHMDNPDKFQYNEAEIECYGGADIGDALKPTYSERKSIMNDIIHFIKDNEIKELQDIVDYSMECNPDWFEVLSESCYFVNQYLKSSRHRIKEEIEKG